MKKTLISISFIIILVIIAFGIVQTNQLSDVQTTLAATQNNLNSTRSELTDAKATLASMEADLSQTQAELSVTDAAFSSNLTELNNLYDKLDQNTFYLGELTNEYKTTSIELAAEEELALTLQNDINNLDINIGFLTTGYGYLMRNQTYQTCKSFIATDQTDKRDWVVGVYEGVNFAADVKTNAIKQKIRCGYVSVRLGGGGNIILVVFDTTDRGIIYIYPPSDEEVILQVGSHFWTQCIVWNPGTYYISPSYNDVVERFNTTW